MNKTRSKNSKVDKCPSVVAHENKIKDVSKNCLLNEKVELKNGLVNGIVTVDESPLCVKKTSRKGKKIKQARDESVNIDEASESESIYILKTVQEGEEKVNQSSKRKNTNSKSDSTVNCVDNNKNGTKNTGVDKLDTNDNISCDNNHDLTQIYDSICEEIQSSNNVKGDQVASSSNSTASVDRVSTDDIAKFSVSDVADSLSGLQLKPKIDFIQYESEMQMPMIMKIIQKDLSEPYSIYTYRYFIHNWPKLCFLAMCGEECVGAIVCKLDLHRKVIKRGYIAMLAVDQNYRKLRIGSNLVQMAINEMLRGDADEVVLETEVTNKPALQLYEKLGFVRDKRLFRYYLNGVDALRLKLWLR